MNSDIETAIKKLSDIIDTNPTADNYYTRGKYYWKLGNKSKAISDFNHAVQIDPQSPAAIYLKMSNDVMDFYNTDLYPP